MKRLLLSGLCALAFAASTVGCAKPFEVHTPPGFIELED